MALDLAPVALLPATPQRLWGRPAVVNFVLGGLGAGFYVAAVALARLGSTPAVTLAAWLGPALVLTGFAAVATEAGRPLRGPRVLAQVRTSWMSRELVLGGLFTALAAAEFVTPHPALRLIAAVAALALASAQGMILRRARAVAAWDVAVMPALFLVSALLSGLGLLVIVESAGQSSGGGALLGATVVVLVAGMLIWLAYVTWSPDAAFVAATRPLREGRSALVLAGVGYMAPFVLVILALALQGGTGLASAAGGVLMIAGQVHAKWVLILGVAALRPVTLAGLTLNRRLS